MTSSLESSFKYSATAVVFVSICCAIWSALVAKEVPEPYLDEVFHVRQAQVYCAGDFYTWDPKITTPPGLYFLSYGLIRFLGSCSINSLRLTNGAFLCAVAVEAYQILKALNTPEKAPKNRSGVTNSQINNFRDWSFTHTAINICLFPPLFFFSGLYYTDIASLLFVLLTYHATILYLQSKSNSFGLVALQLFYGAGALILRQTNVFWVGIFPIGLAALRIAGNSISSSASSSKEVHVEDYFIAGYTAVWGCLSHIPRLLFTTIPYLLLLGLFGTFVAWNGGVVLGDKSNHVATIHLPQMLYLWPYIAFFSFPLLVAGVLGPYLASRDPRLSSISSQFPRIWVLLAFLAPATAVVHFNTIIHPFTLADNRHYVFYVFKIIRKSEAIKYMALPGYLISGWLALNALHTDFVASLDSRSNRASANQNGVSHHSRFLRIGFSIVWIATSALSLITAPLVEPRYFIIPWVIWRLQVSTGASQIEETASKPEAGSKSQSSTSGSLLKLLNRPSSWLWLETGWFIVINVVTGYIFLTKTFEWPQEPGLKQRFMW